MLANPHEYWVCEMFVYKMSLKLLFKEWEIQLIDKALDTLEKIYKSCEQIQKIITLLYKLKKYIAYIIIACVLFVCGCMIPYTKNLLLKTQFAQYVEFVSKRYNIILLIILVGLIFWFLYLNWKSAKRELNFIDREKKLIKKMHIEFIHDIRDNIAQLDEFKSQLEKCKFDSIEIVRQNMYRSLSDNMQVYVDIIQQQLTQYCKNEISVCVKLIEFDDANKEYADTIARSTNTRRVRVKDDERIEIQKNSDFAYLINGKNTFFASSDLVSDNNSGLYKVQDDIEIWNNKYQSTLVVPIRYYSKHSRHNKVNVKLEILGFLCIDSKEKMEDWTSDDSYELAFLAVFADEMYIYLKKFQEIYELKGIKNDK